MKTQDAISRIKSMPLEDKAIQIKGNVQYYAQLFEKHYNIVDPTNKREVRRKIKDENMLLVYVGLQYIAWQLS
jgi:hypothetical protein